MFRHCLIWYGNVFMGFWLLSLAFGSQTTSRLMMKRLRSKHQTQRSDPHENQQHGLRPTQIFTSTRMQKSIVWQRSSWPAGLSVTAANHFKGSGLQALRKKLNPISSKDLIWFREGNWVIWIPCFHQQTFFLLVSLWVAMALNKTTLPA